MVEFTPAFALTGMGLDPLIAGLSLIVGSWLLFHLFINMVRTTIILILLAIIVFIVMSTVGLSVVITIVSDILSSIF